MALRRHQRHVGQNEAAAAKRSDPACGLRRSRQATRRMGRGTGEAGRRSADDGSIAFLDALARRKGGGSLIQNIRVALPRLFGLDVIGSAKLNALILTWTKGKIVASG